MGIKHDYDVVIVGAGPAGSTCAIILGRMGYNVLLVDKARFPRDKACGDGVSGKSVAMLKELGLLNQISSIENLKCNGALVYLTTDIKIELTSVAATGYTSKRIIYDNFLFENAKELVDTLEEFTVTDLILEDSKIAGIKGLDSATKKEMEFSTKVVVGADGANSVVANKMGLNKFEPRHRASALRVYYKNLSGISNKLEIYFFDNIMPGYFWIFPLDNNMANVGLGMLVNDMQKNKISLQELMFKEIEANPILREKFRDAQMIEGSLRGWNLPFGSTHRKIYGNGFVLLGDAASLIDPFTGEGIGNAMLSAKVAAQVIDEAFRKGDLSENSFKKYDALLWREIGKELKSSYTLQRIGTFLVKFKWLRNFMFKKAAKKPHLIQAVSASLVYEENQKKASPLKLLKDFIL